MAILKIKDETGKFVDIPAIQGPPGKDGAIQYAAGDGIKIEDNVISATGGSNYYRWDMNNDDSAIAMFQSWLDEYYKTGCFPTIVANQGGTRVFTARDIDFEPSDKKIYILFGYHNKGLAYNQFNYKVANVTLDSTKTVVTSVSSETLLQAFYPLNRYQYTNSTSISAALDTRNTKAYTPTGDYHPATKKYVDDTIASAITTTLEGEY